MTTTKKKERKISHFSNPNMREVFKALVVEILEGRGTNEEPYEIVRYVITDDGSLIGRIIF